MALMISKHACLLIAVGLCVACTPPLPTPAITLSGLEYPAAGVGTCHWLPGGTHDDVDWGYWASTGVLWRELEPSPGQFDFAPLDNLIARFPDTNFWPSIQTVGAAADGLPKAPPWLPGMGAVWHTGLCENEGIFAPWDSVYQDRLAILLKAVGKHLRDTLKPNVAGIVMMSGGMYGEYQLWSCGMYEHLMNYYGYDQAWQMDDDYYAAVRQIVRLYADSFPDMPLMLQVGTPPNDHAILNWFARKYGEWAWIKWAGLDPDNTGNADVDKAHAKANQRYVDMYKFYRLNSIPAHFGFEPGHPTYYRDDAGNWLTDRFHNVFDWALAAKAEFMCFQGYDMLPALMNVPGWRAFDAALEANADPTSVITPTSTSTVRSTATPTPSNTATVTPTVTPTVKTVWICERCYQATVTPSSQ